MAASQYLATSIVNWIRGTTMPAAAATRYIGLFTAGGTELSGNGYARIAVSAWGTITEGGGSVTVANSEAEISAAATGDWAAATQYRVYDAASAGNALSGLTALETPQTVLEGGSAEFAIGELTFSISTAELGSYLATQIIEWITGITMPAAPTCYVALYTSVPAELSGNGYAREAITWGSTEDITTAIRCRNSATIETNVATATWTAAPNFAIHDAATSGNALSSVQALSTSITVGEGGYARVAANGLSFSMSYAA